MQHAIADDQVKHAVLVEHLFGVTLVKLNTVDHAVNFNMVARQVEHFTRHIGSHHPAGFHAATQFDRDLSRAGTNIEHIARNGANLQQIVHKRLVRCAVVQRVILMSLVGPVHHFRL